MKIRLTFKTPDVVEYAAADAECRAEISEGVDEDVDIREAVREACRPWVQYGEYCTIEIDSEAGTASVVPVS